MGIIALFGLVLSAAAAVYSATLFVRLRFTRLTPGVAHLPFPLTFFGFWMTSWFAVEALRQFVMTRLAPPTAMRLAALVMFFASLFCLAWAYGAVSVVHQFIGNRMSRRIRRGARHASLTFAALLVVAWSAFQYNSDASLFIVLRGMLGMTAVPFTLAAWAWLLVTVQGTAAGPRRDALLLLVRGYLYLFGGLFVLTTVRPFFGGRLAIIPPMLDLVAEALYVIGTAWWIEKRGSAV